MRFLTNYLAKPSVFFFILLCLVPGFAVAGELYFVDAHSQIDHKVSDMSLVTQRMEENDVRVTILAPRGKRKDKEVVNLAKKSGGKIIASIRTKGGIYRKDKQEYYNKLKKNSRSGKFGAIAEVMMFHAQKGEKAEEVDVYPSDKRVKAALKEAKRNGWPFVAHIEFAAISGKKRKRYMTEFEKMLSSNSDYPILLIHMGQLQPGDAERLLSKYKNFHMITSHAESASVGGSSQPWINMFEGKKLKLEWKALMKKYPDQFVYAMDNVWARDWENRYSKIIKLWRRGLSELPAEIAAKIAHGNAERLYKLN